MPARPWTNEELRLLGKQPDRDMARRFGRSVQAIVTKRHLRGIKRFIGPGDRRPWTSAEDRWLGTAPDYKVAQNLG
jgi:hypothetical protein